MTNPTLFVAFPCGPTSLVHWWLVEDGLVVRTGISGEPRSDSGTSGLDVQCIALVSPAMATYYKVAIDGDYPQQQLLAIAIENAIGKAIGGADQLQSAASLDDFGRPWVTVISTSAFALGLSQLQAMDCDPDICVPSASLLPSRETGFVKGDIGGIEILRGPDTCFPNETALVEAIIGGETVSTLEKQDIFDRIGGAASLSLPNLRTGRFAKRRPYRQISVTQKRQIIAGVLALALISLAIPIAAIAKYTMASGNMNDRSLALARTMAPEAKNLSQGRQLISDKLKSIGQNPDRFTALSGVLFRSLQSAPDVMLINIAYQPSGLLSATLSGARKEDINVALLALQRDGYTITAIPRTEATGNALAEITLGVR